MFRKLNKNFLCKKRKNILNIISIKKHLKLKIVLINNNNYFIFKFKIAEAALHHKSKQLNNSIKHTVYEVNSDILIIYTQRGPIKQIMVLTGLNHVCN